MELSRKSCRICLNESEFNVSLFGSYCRRTNMANKIVVCLKLVIEESDFCDTICYKCATNIEKYYDFIMLVKKSQNKIAASRPRVEAVNRGHVTSYVREQVIDADYSFSFLEIPDEKKEKNPSTPLFSYFSPPAVKSESNHVWKTPKNLDSQQARDSGIKKQFKLETPRYHSRDLFESQSQNSEEADPTSFDWKLSQDDNILKRIRQKCFGRSDF